MYQEIMETKTKISVIRDYDGFFYNRVLDALHLAQDIIGRNPSKKLVSKIVIDSGPFRVLPFDSSLDNDNLYLNFHSSTRITHNFAHTVEDLANLMVYES